MKRRRRSDANQTEVVRALRAIGATVKIVSPFCDEFDLVVGFRGKNFLLELKDGSKPPSRQSLTDNEDEFLKAWSGQIAIANSADAAINIVRSR